MGPQIRVTEHPGKVVEDSRFGHMMALTLDPRTEYRRGLVRCVTSREGDLTVRGYVDRSELRHVSGESLERFAVGDRLTLQNEDEVLATLIPPEWEYIGPEDPDIWIDPDTHLVHVYFTIPIKPPVGKGKIRIHLGHAVGFSLDALHMEDPVLLDNLDIGALGKSAKEVSIAPINSRGIRYNLIESRDRSPEVTYSVIRVAVATEMNGPWEYGDIVFHPRDHDLSWIGGHASPGPLFPKTFYDPGPGKLLGAINGREANRKEGDRIIYGTFSVGLFIYDYELGKIDWVSPKPLIRDSEATTITFASQFVETAPGEGILYAHVDDSFVRAYTLKAS